MGVPLIENGQLMFYNGLPLFGPNYDCCCQQPCCCLGLDCCYGTGDFSVAMDCWGIVNPNFNITWQFVTATDGGCMFIWQLDYHYGREGVPARYVFAVPPAPSCDAVDGVYFPGDFFQPFEFDYEFFPFSSQLCDWRNATVEIQKDGEGFWFTIRGLVSHPNGFCDDCHLLDGTYYVPCFP